MSKWKQTTAAAKADPTLRQLALSVRELNKAGRDSRAAYAAFRDRVAELGLTLPPGYDGILLDIVLYAAMN